MKHGDIITVNLFGAISSPTPSMKIASMPSAYAPKDILYVNYSANNKPFIAVFNTNGDIKLPANVDLVPTGSGYYFNIQVTYAI